MGKREAYIDQILPLMKREHLINELEQFLLSNSNLPGPRANLELAFAFADCFKIIAFSNFDLEFLQKWSEITEEQAPVNNAMVFLPFCAIITFGSLYERVDEEFKKLIIEILKACSTDNRWRIREAVAMGFQRIAEKNFMAIFNTFSTWIEQASVVEQRAIIATLAHPPILKEKNNVRFCFHIAEKIFHNFQALDKDVRKSEHFRILKKGLAYTLSVFVAHLPDDGFSFLRKWAQVNDADISRILKTNLKKSRLTKFYRNQVNEVLLLIEK